jgi:hypothetical protein
MQQRPDEAFACLKAAEACPSADEVVYTQPPVKVASIATASEAVLCVGVAMIAAVGANLPGFSPVQF